MMRNCHRNRAGFTLVELIVVIVFIALLGVFLWPNITTMRQRAQRVNCLGNLNQMWKAVSAWGLSSENAGAGTNGLGVFKELPPDAFICPEAGRLCKMSPDTNGYYQYYSGRRDSDADKIILCDMNGPNQIAGPGAWGGNHGGKGGNVVKVAGSGLWMELSPISNQNVSYDVSTQGVVVLHRK